MKQYHSIGRGRTYSPTSKQRKRRIDAVEAKLRVGVHVQKLSSKIITKQRNKLTAECGTARKSNKRKTQDDAEAIEIEGASIFERVRYDSKRGRVSMRRLY